MSRLSLNISSQSDLNDGRLTTCETKIVKLQYWTSGIAIVPTISTNVMAIT